MSAYRFYNPVPVIFDIYGIKPAIGGSLTFYEKGTTTPKQTWADQGLTTPNPNPLPLDGSGRPTTDIWLDGAYTVVAKNSAGVLIDEADIDSPVPPGISLPAPAAGKFIQGNGTQWVAVDLFLLPDPTGMDGYAVVANGGAYGLQPFPVAPTLPVATGTGFIKVNGNLIKWGTGSAPATNARQSAVAVTFPTSAAIPPFLTCAHVDVSPTTNNHTAGGQIGVKSITVMAATTFSVSFDTDDFGQTNANITNPIPFTWVAFGTCDPAWTAP